MRDVIITGVGITSSAGLSADKTFSNLLDDKSYATPITDFNPEEYNFSRAKVSASINNFKTDKFQKGFARFSYLALEAAREAVKDSGLDLQNEELERVGVSIGSCSGGLKETFEEYKRGRYTPYFPTKQFPDMASGIVSIDMGIKGPFCADSTACAAGLSSIESAVRQIQIGKADVMIAGGADSLVSPPGIAIFDIPGAHTREELPYPVRPFDSSRDGTMNGEGAGVLVLESSERVNSGGYGKITGAGRSGDAEHPVRPNPDGGGIRQSMQSALNESGIDCPDYVFSHATGTKKGDIAEAKAINSLFSSEIPVTSVKGGIGHTFGAAGSINAALASKSLREDLVLPTVGYSSVGKSIPLENIASKPIKLDDISSVICNASGFGGSNASIVIENFDN